jgi:hypothetical protein
MAKQNGWWVTVRCIKWVPNLICRWKNSLREMMSQPRKLNTPTNKKNFLTLHFRDFGSSSQLRVLYSVIHAQRARLWPTWRKINSCSKQQMRRDRASVKFLSNENGHQDISRGRRISSQSFVINPILYAPFQFLLRSVHIPERNLCFAHLFCLSGILNNLLRRSIYSLLCICWNYRHTHTHTGRAEEKVNK